MTAVSGAVSLADHDQSQDAAIEASLDLTPEERFARLEAWAAFLAEARKSAA